MEYRSASQWVQDGQRSPSLMVVMEVTSYKFVRKKKQTNHRAGKLLGLEPLLQSSEGHFKIIHLHLHTHQIYVHIVGGWLHEVHL